MMLSNRGSTYDIAVVGAGPAGATAARYLSQAGLKVIILEKAAWPRYKTCGGGLTARAKNELPDDLNLPVHHLCHSSTIHISNSDLHFTARRSRPIIYMTMRDELDAELVKSACNAGAEFQHQCQVNGIVDEDGIFTINTGLEIFKARMLVAADGVKSRVAVWLGFSDNRILAPAIEWEVPLTSPQINHFADNALFEFGHFKGGYAWIFPKAEHISVGLGAMRGQGRNLTQELTTFLQSHEIPAATATLRKGQLIPVSPRKGFFAQNRCFLVGDAAGLVDPVTAEGLTYAMRSGRLAAEAIIETQAHPVKSAELYQHKLQSSLLREIRYGTWLAMLLFNMPKWRNWLFQRHGQRFTEGMADLVMGEKNYSDVVQQSSFWLRLLGKK